MKSLKEKNELLLKDISRLVDEVISFRRIKRKISYREKVYNQIWD